MISTKRFVGIINPLGNIICFATPIFTECDAVDNSIGYFCQNINKTNGKIESFTEISIPLEEIITIDKFNGFNFRKGDDAIFSFYFGEENYFVGLKHELGRMLIQKYSILEEKPFLMLEIADFLDNKSGKLLFYHKAYIMLRSEKFKDFVKHLDDNIKPIEEIDKIFMPNIIKAHVPVREIAFIESKERGKETKGRIPNKDIHRRLPMIAKRVLGRTLGSVNIPKEGVIYRNIAVPGTRYVIMAGKKLEGSIKLTATDIKDIYNNESKEVKVTFEETPLVIEKKMVGGRLPRNKKRMSRILAPRGTGGKLFGSARSKKNR